MKPNFKNIKYILSSSQYEDWCELSLAVQEIVIDAIAPLAENLYPEQISDNDEQPYYISLCNHICSLIDYNIYTELGINKELYYKNSAEDCLRIYISQETCVNIELALSEQAQQYLEILKSLPSYH